MEKIDPLALCDWRCPDTDQTLLQRFMFKSADAMRETVTVYMIETIRIDPRPGIHELIAYGYFRSISKIISMGIALGPIDMIISALNSLTDFVIHARSYYSDLYILSDELNTLACMIDALITGEYNCLTNDIREKIITNNLHV